MKILLLAFICLPSLAYCQSAQIFFKNATTEQQNGGNNPNGGQNKPNNGGSNANTATPLVIFYGSAALSGGSTSSDLSSSFTASGKFSATVNPAGSFFIDIGSNLVNVNPAKTKLDSVDFNSLMFPESGNFGVFFSPYYRYDIPGWDGISVVPLYEFAYRKYAIDSPNVAFKIINHTLGIKLQWHYEPSASNEVTVGLTFYKNWFIIPSEDVKNFTSIVNDSSFSSLAANNKSLTVGSLGVKLTFQYNTMLFFADFRNNAHTSSLADSDPFKGTVVNIGFSTFIKLGSF